MFFMALIVAFLAGILARDYLPLPIRSGELSILREANAILRSNAHFQLPEDPALEYGMIRGMLQAYGDPFSVFLEPVQTELETHSLQGSYGGIGSRMGTDGEGFIVLFPFPDGPAEQAGVLEGDRLLRIDELEVSQETPMDAILAAVRGPVGKRVTLAIARPPQYNEQTVTIKREEIALPSVTSHLEPVEPRLGVIEINIIAATTPKEIQKAVTDLQSRGATHFVLDLRDNGGGLLSTGVETSRLFMPEGDIIQQQYHGRQIETQRADKAGPLVDVPLAILMNHNTASAAEIIAGSLQANRRAILVGTPSFGKNTIQLVFNLQDGSSMHITAASWWIPGLEFPNDGHGLEPDVALSDEASTDPQAAIQAAIQAFFGAN